ncbi:MAG: Holliday junction branch migration DNA helicase RuvB [Bacilli bacterium]
MEINENGLRPKYLKEFIGQKELIYKLSVYIDAARKRKEVLDHILFYGPAGCGKTTLANLIANEMSVNIKVINAANIEKPYELISVLLSLAPGDILFIDEIHRLSRQLEEILYSAMEDFYIESVINKNETTKDIHIDLPPFTLIGATTLFGLISSPLRMRFPICEKLSFYSISDMIFIINRSAKIYDIKITEEASKNIAKRSRGIPRIGNNLLKRIRDFACFRNKKIIDNDIVEETTAFLKINEIGLNEDDLLYIKTLYNKGKCLCLGINSLAVLLNYDIKTIEDTIEPYLLKIYFIEKSSKGRILTSQGLTYIKKNLNLFLD